MMSATHKSLNLCKVMKHIDYDLIDSAGRVIKNKKSSLIHYLGTIKQNDLVPIPGDPDVRCCPLLSQDVLYLMIDLLQIAKDTFDANLCWQNLDENDIMIMLDQRGTPKLTENVVFVPASRAAIDYSMFLLGEIFENVILRNCNKPEEIRDFLDLFKVDGSKNRTLIYVHCALVPISAKADYICNVQDFLKNHVKKINRKHYNSILSAMVFPSDWEVHALANNYLRDCYNARNPGGGATSTGQTNPQTGKSRKVKHMPSAQGSSTGALIKTANSAAAGTATPHACRSILQNPEASKALHLHMSKSNQVNIALVHSNKNVQGTSNAAMLSGVPSSSGAGNKSRGRCGGASASQVVGASTRPTNLGNPRQSGKAQHMPSAQGSSTRTHIKIVNSAAAGIAAPQTAGKTAASKAMDLPISKSNQVNTASAQANINVQGNSNAAIAMLASIPSSSGAGNTSKYNAPGSDPREEVLTFYRNVGRHGMDLP